MATYVQSWTGANQQSGTTGYIAFSPSPSAHNHLRLASFIGANRKISSITDDASNTWHSVASRADNAQGTVTELWYVENISGTITSATVTYSASGTNIELFADEYSGVTTSGSLDTSITSITPGNAASPLTIGPTGVTTNANDNIYTIAAQHVVASRPLSIAGYTKRSDDSAVGFAHNFCSADVNVTSTGAQTAVWSWTGGNGNVTGILAAFIDAPLPVPQSSYYIRRKWGTLP